MAFSTEKLVAQVSTISTFCVTQHVIFATNNLVFQTANETQSVFYLLSISWTETSKERVAIRLPGNDSYIVGKLIAIVQSALN